MVFIDLAKTFDTVSHNSIEKGLTRKGILDQVRGTITEMYDNKFSERKATREIKINAVVKQGCPPSLLLFSLIIDELLQKLQKLKHGNYD